MDFSKIMEFHVDNPIVYEKIKKQILNRSLVPFIGAGMSAFAYPSWIPYLDDLARKYIADKEERQPVLEMLTERKCEEAAEHICKIMGKNHFFQILQYTFSADKINDQNLMQQAVFIIPSLFRHLLLTTNLDLVLERAFLLNKLQLEVKYPGDNNALNRSLRGNTGSTLFKFHGDINTNYNDLVFTKTSYDNHYGSETKLIQSLKTSMQSKSLLFIGCSLYHDRTLAVLDTILEEGMENYAIVSCNNGEQLARAKELSNRQIFPLIYPFTNNNNSLYIILERLSIELGEPSNFAGYFTRNECLNNILGVQLRSFAKKRLVFFGGVSSRLSSEDDTNKLIKWLANNPEANLFFCYEKDEGADNRGKRTDNAKLEKNIHLSDDAVQRMRQKAKMLEDRVASYPLEIRNRVHLIPLSGDLSTYPIIVDDDIYCNILTSGKNLNSATVKLLDNRIGRKIRRDIVDYMRFELENHVISPKRLDIALLDGILHDIISEDFCST